MRKTEQPTRASVNSPVGETRETHPAYGQLSFSRCQGDPGVLYGTHLDKHPGFIRMTLSSSDRMHGLSRDWHFPGKVLVEVEMSHVQFAELITTMNQGSGIPCTIRKLPGDWDIPAISHLETEQKRVQLDFKDKIQSIANEAREGMKQVDTILSQPSLKKADREALRSHFAKWHRMITDSAPFVLDQFQESVEKTATAAKAEVDGFISNLIASTGLAALRDKFGTPELPDGENFEFDGNDEDHA